MPTASDRLRGRMNELFGDPVDDNGPMTYLESKGFTLTKQWFWVPPEGHVPTKDEWDCIDFLIQEWDFGGLA